MSKVFVWSVLGIALCLPLSGLAQDSRVDPSARGTSQSPAVTSSAPGSPASIILASADEDYRIGVGDVIEIRVEDAPELSGNWQITASGSFMMTVLNRVVALNKTPEELQKEIADGLRGKYLKNPQVRVAVRQFNSRSFFIQGQVKNPGIYQVGGKPTLLKLITIAGGLNEKHGSTAYILREIKTTASGNPALTAITDEAGNKVAASESKEDTTAQSATTESASEKAGAQIEGARYELVKASISGLMLGNLGQNLIIEPGDIVTIPQRDVFFVSGEVRAPGEFLLKEGTTLRQAIALAQGETVKAALNRAVIFRDDKVTGKAQEIAIDIAAIMKGKNPDIAIAPNDVIVIPNSRMKTVGTALLSAFGMGAVQRIPIGSRY